MEYNIGPVWQNCSLAYSDSVLVSTNVVHNVGPG